MAQIINNEIQKIYDQEDEEDDDEYYGEEDEYVDNANVNTTADQNIDDKALDPNSKVAPDILSGIPNAESLKNLRNGGANLQKSIEKKKNAGSTSSFLQ